MSEDIIIILGILGNDKNIIPYRKELNKITGGITSTILLQQVIYWHQQMEGKPFFKFIEPCDHKEYKKGDSWCEELGMTKYEFSTAYKRLEKLKIVSKKINAQRVTYWTLNTDILAMLIKSIYLSGHYQHSTSQKSTYLSGQSQHTSITKTTAETTQRETHAQNSSFPFFEDEFGKDEQSNHVGIPSLNQTRAEAKRLGIDASIAQSFWLHYESTAWRGVVDWVPKLRKWAMGESKYGKVGESTEPTFPPAPKIERPTTVEELKLWFVQLPKEKREKIAIKTRTGAVVRVNSRGVLVVQEDWGNIDDWYALESDSMEKMMAWMVDGFDERVRVA